MEKLNIRTMMIKQSGFTLVELLIVLSAWSVLLLLIVPITFNSLEEVHEQQFLKTFEHDILYLQRLAMTSQNKNNRLKIREKEGRYYILSGSRKEMERTIPSDWQVSMGHIDEQIIAFNKNGTIRKAGTLTLTTGLSTYKIIFPLGKGRGYIVKQ